MKELEKLIMALHKNIHNLLRFSSPAKKPPVLTAQKAGWAPEPVWTLWRRETSCPYPQSNPSCPPLCLSRHHGHSSDKNGVYSTSHLFFTWFQSSIASFMRACSYQPYPSAIWATQPLTEMSTRNLPGGKGQPVHGADNLTAICELIV
jgi:hypothetical protein